MSQTGMFKVLGGRVISLLCVGGKNDIKDYPGNWPVISFVLLIFEVFLNFGRLVLRSLLVPSDKASYIGRQLAMLAIKFFCGKALKTKYTPIGSSLVNKNFVLTQLLMRASLGNCSTGYFGWWVCGLFNGCIEIFMDYLW